MLRAKVPREAACQPSLMRRRLDLALLLHRLLVLHGYTQCRRAGGISENQLAQPRTFQQNRPLADIHPTALL